MYPEYATPVAFKYMVNLGIELWIVGYFLKSVDNPIKVVIGLLQTECHYPVFV